MDSRFAAVLSVLLAVMLFGCMQPAAPSPTPAVTPTPTVSPSPIFAPEDQATLACKLLCENELAKGRDLSNGPCLSNEIVEDWVCDVAHEPRQAVDNLPENQCPAFREGRAKHFVEVTPECKFIKKW